MSSVQMIACVTSLMIAACGLQAADADQDAPTATLETGVTEFLRLETQKTRTQAGGTLFNSLVEQYGRDEVVAEIVRQFPSADKASDDQLRVAIYSLPLGKGILPYAVKGLSLNDPADRTRSVELCWILKAKLSAEVIQKYQIVAQQLFLSGDMERQATLLCVLDTMSLDKATLDALRKFVNESLRRSQEYMADLGYMPFGTVGLGPYALARPHTCTQGLIILARCGEEQAVREIQQSIKQGDDAERCAWGMWVAAKSRNDVFLSALESRLGDETVCPEPVARYNIPGTARQHKLYPPPFGPDGKRVDKPTIRIVTAHDRRTCFTRLGDVALRAMCQIQPPDKSLGFEVPTLDWWEMMETAKKNESTYAYRRDTADIWEEGLRDVETTVGFSREQVREFRSYLVKTRESAARAMRTKTGAVSSSGEGTGG